MSVWQAEGFKEGQVGVGGWPVNVMGGWGHKSGGSLVALSGCFPARDARQSLWSCSTAKAVLFQCVTRQPALHLASVPARLLQALI